jgi:hypothetical protein
MENLRQLHLRGALSAARTELWEGREHLVVPVVALMEGVIHAVNAKTAEYVPASTLSAAAESWNGRPLVLGHPTKDGQQISANDPSVLATHGFGFIRSTKMNGNRLGMEAFIDPQRLESLGQTKLLQDLREGRGCEVSVGAFVRTNDKKGVYQKKSYEGEWVGATGDHLAFLPHGIGACSIEMGCGAHRAAMLVTAEGFEVLGGPGSSWTAENGHVPGATASIGKGLSMSIPSLKARILALFDTPEQAASEEAAELVAYRSMRTLLDGVSDQYDEASTLVDALIADEEEHPTDTPAQEEAETEVEDARLDSLRMLCYSMSTLLQNVATATYALQVPDAVTPSDPRYMEQLKALIGKSISAKNMKTVQAAHDSSHDMHTSTVALGAQCNGMKLLASKECKTCGGVGQVKVDGKQSDCPECDGYGSLKVAEFKAACRCEEDGMHRTERIAALIANTHNPMKDLTDKTSDEVLTVLEAQATANAMREAEHATALKAAQDKAAETEAALRAAQAAQIPAAELVQLRALAEERKAADAAQKASVVTQLKVAAKGVYTDEELDAKPLAELQKIAQLARVETADFSARGIPIPRGVATENFTPPDPYEAGIKALQTAPRVN